jgi:protein-ribulosamine 3-kinase
MNVAFLETALRRELGDPRLRIGEARAVGGGCIHETARLCTSAGDFFAKWSAHAPPDVFRREAEGLEALRAAKSEIVIPKVMAVSGADAREPAFLILEYLPPALGGSQDDERLGHGLAQIHRRTAARFGFPSPSYCGRTLQDNAECDSWPEFYRERRLSPLLAALERDEKLDPSDRRLYERVMERLPEILPRGSPPALVHGDLWSGNVLSSARGPALVDPACAHVDREMEFGITTVFGGLPPRAWAAYEEAWPLPAGWRDRNPLYQVYHLLNHALLFGGHYASQARKAALRYVS